MKKALNILVPETAHVLMISFLLGGAGAILIGLQDVLREAENTIRPALKVVVFLKTELSDQDARKWTDRLPAQDSDLTSAVYISTDDALSRAQGNPTLAKSLVLLRENPLPASVVLQYSDMAWLERPEPAVQLQSMPEVQEIRWSAEARSRFRALRQGGLWLARASAFAMVMLVVWAFFGLYRFLATKARPAALLVQLGLGFLGGGLSVGILLLSLRSLGADAAAYRPDVMSPWPLVCAVMGALATFGWKVPHEN